MPHKGQWADEVVRRAEKTWDDRSSDAFRPFAHPEEYDSWRKGERPPSPPSGSFQEPAAGSSKQRYVPPAARKRFEARQAAERGYDGYVQEEYRTPPVDTWRPTPTPPQDATRRSSRGYSPSAPADGQYEAASSNRDQQGTQRENASNYRRGASAGSIPTENRRHIARASEEPSSSRRTRDNTPQPTFQLFLPAPEYVALSRKPVRSSPPIISPKLLVLDLNGTLVYRSSSNSPPHPRPYLSSFLQYLFMPEPMDADGQIPQRPWEAFVWSSAQPHNVRKMVTAAFGERWIRGLYDAEDGVETNDEREAGEGRLTGVWARDKMNLSSVDYSRKVQTVKDLRILLNHLQEVRSRSVDAVPDFDESNTVLLDDSPLKAVHQPWSQLIIPEYDHEAYQLAKHVVRHRDDHPPAKENGFDVTLLAVVGILEELRTVDSVPAWIRTEGLMTMINGPPRKSIIDVRDEPTFETLPSHDSFLHWHKNVAMVEHWRQKGLSALERKGITAEIGLPKDDSRSSRSATPQRDVRRQTPQRDMLSPHGSVRTLSSLPERPASPPIIRQDAQGARRYLHSTDSWRTFRASDVALYLQDVADRPSSLSSTQRQTLLDTIETLSSIGPSAEWEDGHIATLRDGVWDRDICEDCLLTAAEREKKRLNVEQIKEHRKGLKVGRRLMRLGGKIEKAELQAAGRTKAQKKKARMEEAKLVAAQLESMQAPKQQIATASPQIARAEAARPAGPAGSSHSTSVEPAQSEPIVGDAGLGPKEVVAPTPASRAMQEQIEAGHRVIEDGLRTSLRERAIGKALLETIRQRGGSFHLQGSREGHCAIRDQLDSAQSRITRLEKKLLALGKRSPFEIADSHMFAPSDLQYLAEATLNKVHKKYLKELDISPADFMAGRTLPEGVIVGPLHAPVAPTSPSKRSRSDTVTSHRSHMAPMAGVGSSARKKSRNERYAAKRLAEMKTREQESGSKEAAPSGLIIH